MFLHKLSAHVVFCFPHQWTDLSVLLLPPAASLILWSDVLFDCEAAENRHLSSHLVSCFGFQDNLWLLPVVKQLLTCTWWQLVSSLHHLTGDTECFIKYFHSSASVSSWLFKREKQSNSQRWGCAKDSCRLKGLWLHTLLFRHKHTEGVTYSLCMWGMMGPYRPAAAHKSNFWEQLKQLHMSVSTWRAEQPQSHPAIIRTQFMLP